MEAYLTEEQIKNLVNEEARKHHIPHYSHRDKIELVRDPNVVDGGNFPIKRNGKEYWVSRSNTISLYLYGYNKFGELCVLASLRGPGARGGNGKWNIIAGFLDYGYSLEDTAVKECWEEAGVKIDKRVLMNSGTNSSRLYDAVNTRFVGMLEKPIENYPTSTVNCEMGEVTKAEWIPLSQISKYNFWGEQGKHAIEIGERLINKRRPENTQCYEKFIECLKEMMDNGIVDQHDCKKIIDIISH